MKITLLIITFVLSILSNILLPFSGLLIPFVFLLSTSLFIALAVRSNIVYSLFSAAFSIAILYFLSNSVILAAIFPLTCILSATGVYIALKTKSDFKMTLLGGTAGYFLLIAAIYFVFGGNFVADAVAFIKAGFFESLDALSASLPAGTDASTVAEIKSVYTLFFENLMVLAPSLILSLIFLLSYFSIKISSHWAKGSEMFAQIPAFSQMHAPFILFMITVISYAGQLSENAFISGLMANLFMVLSVYYTLCGFSLIDFFIKRKTNSLVARTFIMIGIIIVLTILSMFMPFANPVLLAMFAGVMDTLFNYRLRAGNAPKNRT